jgi:hypothetical protein
VDIAPKQAHGSITWQTSQQMPREHPKKTIEISGSLYQRMEDVKPEYLSTTAFFQLMADKGLGGIDMPFKIPEPPQAVTSERSNKTNKERARDSSKTRTQYSDEFNEFWGTYQSSPSKANGQSKPKAWDAWGDATKQETPERLVEAARKAVEEVRRLQQADEFCAPLPDAFRWLRDGRYVVLLEESHTHTHGGLSKAQRDAIAKRKAEIDEMLRID